MRWNLVFFGIFALAFLGCINLGGSFDPVLAAKASGQVQDFLKDHPNAKVVAVLLTEPQIRDRLTQYPDCSLIKPEAMYFVTFQDESTKVAAFVSESQKKALCVIVEGSGKSPVVSGESSTTTAASASERNSAKVLSETSAEVQGESLVEYQNERQGYRVLKPASWTTQIMDDSYLVIKKDENTDALIWPLKLQGEYAKMSGMDLGNYVIGLIKKQFPDFQTEKISVSPDKSSFEVVATVTFEGVKLRGVFTTFVDAKGNGFLAGYEAPIETFEASEPVLRKIISSYAPIVTENTKAAVGPQISDSGTQTGATSFQLVPFASGDGGFSFNAPSGWKIESLGSCSTKSMAAYDPQNPIRRVFAINSNSLTMPISSATAEAVAIDGLPTLNQYVSAYGTVSNVQVSGARLPYPATDGAPGLVDAAVFDITLTVDGKPAKGSVGTYVLDPSGGLGAGGVYYVSLAGSISEPEAFDTLIGSAYPAESRGPLGKSVGSFQVSQSYANACTASGQADISRRTGDLSSTLSETSDIITGGYNERSQVNDRISQKWSDTTLGLDRVYNPDRDEVYHVPNNFYENYDLNRQKFEMQNLQELSPQQWNDYAPLDGALNIG